MDVRVLRYFLAVAREENITRAAESLHIAATYNVVHGTPISFVQQGLGYFLTTRDMLAPVLDERICFRPLTPSLIMRQALVWKKHAVFSKAAKAFYEQINRQSK